MSGNQDEILKEAVARASADQEYNNDIRQQIYSDALGHFTSSSDFNPNINELISTILLGHCFTPPPGAPVSADVVSKMAQLSNPTQLNIISQKVQGNSELEKAFVKGVLCNKSLPQKKTEPSDDMYEGLSPETLRVLAANVSAVAANEEADGNPVRRRVLFATKHQCNEANKMVCEEIFEKIIVQLPKQEDFDKVVGSSGSHMDFYGELVQRVNSNSLEKLIPLGLTSPRYDQLLEAVDKKDQQYCPDSTKTKIVDALFLQASQKKIQLTSFSVASLSTLAKYTGKTTVLQKIIPALQLKSVFVDNSTDIHQIDRQVLKKLIPHIKELKQLAAIAKSKKVDGDVFSAILDRSEKIAEEQVKEKIKTSAPKGWNLWNRFREFIGKPSDTRKKEIEQQKQEVQQQLSRHMVNVLSELNAKKLAIEQDELTKLEGERKSLEKIESSIVKYANNLPEYISVDDVFKIKGQSQQQIDQQLAKKMKVMSGAPFPAPPINIANSTFVTEILKMLDEDQKLGDKRIYDRIDSSKSDSSKTEVYSGRNRTDKLMEIDATSNTVSFPLGKDGKLSNDQSKLFVKSLFAVSETTPPPQPPIVQLDVSGFDATNAHMIMDQLLAIRASNDPTRNTPLVNITFKSLGNTSEDMPKTPPGENDKQSTDPAIKSLVQLYDKIQKFNEQVTAEQARRETVKSSAAPKPPEALPKQPPAPHPPAKLTGT